MKKHTIARILMAGGLAGGVLFAGSAAAIDWNITGFVRQEIAVGISTQENPNNEMGNPFNGRVVPMMTWGDKDPGTGKEVGFGTFAQDQVFTSADNGYASGDPRNAANFNPLHLSNSEMPVHADHQNAAEFIINGEPFLSAGHNTSSPVDCHFSQQFAIAAGSAGILGLTNGIPGAGVGFPGILCPNGQGSVGSRVALDGKFSLGSKVNGLNGVGLAKGGNAIVGNVADFAAPGSVYFLDAKTKDNIDFNVFNSRLEMDVQAKISSEFSAYMKMRIYYDGTRHFTDGKIGDSFGPDRSSNMWSNRRQTLLEVNTPDAIFDLPAFYLDWNRGPLWLRAGNQVIAWGEAYFFRTMDVANGLDLRRHLTLGPGAEEYQDQRVASPGLRLSYTFNNGFELDAFTQMFSPTVLPSQNTAYNLIPVSGARLNDTAGMESAKGTLNYGARMTMPVTEQATVIFGVVNRRNPDGVFRNVDAPTVNAGHINTGCRNQFNDTLNFLRNANGNPTGDFGLGLNQFNTNGRTMENGCGSAFAPDPLGTPSLQYWQAIQHGRLNNQHYLKHVINDFPAAKWAVRDIFNFGAEQNFADTVHTLEGFRSAFGPFIQWVGREFKRETIFMAGGNYIVHADDPNSLLDQLIVRGEVSVTPSKRLTSDLEFNYKEVNDIVSSLILEKYQRFSDAFPATYMVAQWMHRTQTDLFGRDLSNNNTPNLDTFIDPKTGNFTAAAFDSNAMKPKGSSSADYVVFAFQQPFPNLIWRLDMAVLVDVAGGYLFQPGVRYRPSAKWQWDLYATVIGSPGGHNDTITESLDFADEVFVRATYFF